MSYDERRAQRDRIDRIDRIANGLYAHLAITPNLAGLLFAIYYTVFFDFRIFEMWQDGNIAEGVLVACACLLVSAALVEKVLRGIVD